LYKLMDVNVFFRSKEDFSFRYDFNKEI
jgi:hypothetical protein